ncbi:hypothetical protein [Denitromonas iodatirespirans]|uniref:Uncharacterized protein n=1 Tax=Denitromonas iodatirespirans TaxID=2795389 RepID=A0A944H6J7_DENI1|nr:hypothetical protein [Denitromonas iodatirespirans]MBT0960249.1 hypothetical protein [Denitromonas iodatirespirans]
MLHYQVQSIGRNRGTPRVWLLGLVLARAGFEVGAVFTVAVAALRIELVFDGQGGCAKALAATAPRLVPPNIVSPPVRTIPPYLVTS